MNKTIDLVRVRKALAELDRLVAEHHDRCNPSGPKWADNLDELDKMTMGTPVKTRIKDYRARLLAKGYKAATVYLSTETHERLLRLSQQADMAYGDLIGLALKQYKPVAQNSATIQLDFEPPLESVRRRYGDSAMWDMVERYLAERRSGAEIARRLTALGYKSSNGAILRGYQILADLRRRKAT